ncbi:MAG: glycerol-3-phosphate 1-O-acyltransferase PlsY [Candidatus Delongbacteria bacterium]|nr:glycerol-3-phosphate 1-O-acyltransferase PlsY [Candidatus Delongbacteria bacterium]
MLHLTLLIIIAYLIGSFPTSILLVRAVKRVDIRDFGSGNAGGTNVSRVLGWGWGLSVILVDACKGFVAGALLPLLLPVELLVGDPGSSGVIGGVAAILGHVFPLFARFRGGKGVATAAGVAIAITQPLWVILGVLLVFGVILISTRFMFLASMSGGIVYALLVLIFTPAGVISLRVFAVACGLLLIVLHRANIGRWLRGEENRLGRKTAAGPDDELVDRTVTEMVDGPEEESNS